MLIKDLSYFEVIKENILGGFGYIPGKDLHSTNTDINIDIENVMDISLLSTNGIHVETDPLVIDRGFLEVWYLC